MDAGFVTWSDRETPLAACAVAAHGNVAQRLARRLLECSDESLHRLSGVAGKNSMVLLGETLNLPWVDGVIYLGRDDTAPSLLLPTHRQPRLPPANLLDRAMTTRFSKVAPPLAVFPDTLTVISCHRALRLSRRHIESWLAEEKR